MRAIDEARCHLCNRPWPLRARACPVWDGESPIEHEWVVPVAAVLAAIDRGGALCDERELTQDPSYGVGWADAEIALRAEFEETP